MVITKYPYYYDIDHDILYMIHADDEGKQTMRKRTVHRMIKGSLRSFRIFHIAASGKQRFRFDVITKFPYYYGIHHNFLPYDTRRRRGK